MFPYSESIQFCLANHKNGENSIRLIDLRCCFSILGLHISTAKIGEIEKEKDVKCFHSLPNNQDVL